LHGAHDAIHQWARSHGRTLAGVSWEIYGDWSDDRRSLKRWWCISWRRRRRRAAEARRWSSKIAGGPLQQSLVQPITFAVSSACSTS
jgi:hypothetical protein